MNLKDKTVLVTGATGFVGSHLINRLISEGARVIAASHRTVKFPPDVSVHVGHIEDKKFISSILEQHRVHVIFHLAAQALVEEGRDDPTDTFDVNIKGTWLVLEAARQYRVPNVIIASTVHVYGDNPHVPFTEKLYPQPSRPYETSKAAADLLAQTYADTYGMAVEIPRFANVYGPGDRNTNRIIPKIMCALARNRKPVIWDIGAVRDFLYIDDAIDGYILLATIPLPKRKRGRIINFGTGIPVSITTVAKKILSVAGTDKQISFRKPPAERIQEIKRQYVSIEKAKKLLGWEPRVKLRAGLEMTYDWYRHHASEIC